MNVTGVPFNYAATRDVGALRVGFVAESFEALASPAAKANAAKTLATLTELLGVSALVPVEVPDQRGMMLEMMMGFFGVESTAFFGARLSCRHPI